MPLRLKRCYCEGAYKDVGGGAKQEARAELAKRQARLIREADIALYQAKRMGRNQVQSAANVS